MYVENPKMVGSNLLDCKPQKGLCPVGCNQCFYNRPGASYVDPDKLNIPTKKMAKDKIVRMNSLHDSNVKKSIVLAAAMKYDHVFFNTSLQNFDFPGPVVYTANSSEEESVDTQFLRDPYVDRLMFVRLRVSTTNLLHVAKAVEKIRNDSDISIVLTFMAYYDEFALPSEEHLFPMKCYVWKVRHINKYHCPTKAFKQHVLDHMRNIAHEQVTICGTLDSNWCRDCRNCEAYYWIANKRLRGS